LPRNIKMNFKIKLHFWYLWHQRFIQNYLTSLRILRYDQILIVFSGFRPHKYMAGITNNVKTKEKIVPPTITTPIPFYL
jgi:hypothetical protein